MKSFIGWVGAKTKLAPSITSVFPKHKGYCEVFGGGGSILFYKNQSPAEIYNDYNSELVNLFTTVRDNPEELMELIGFTLSSREEFQRFFNMTSEEIESETTLRRALRFYYLVKNSFGQNPASGSFSSCQTAPIRWNPKSDLMPAMRRLSKVTIENLDFEVLIKKYDNPSMLFYLDPPYFVAEGKRYYEFDFDETQHLRLRDSISPIEGKFVMSYDDVPEVHELYKEFIIKKSDPITYTLSAGKNSSTTELLIYNYDPQEESKQMRLML